MLPRDVDALGNTDYLYISLCLRDYVGEMNHHANFGLSRCSGGFSHIGEILPLCDFFDCPYLFSRSYSQVELLD